MQDRSTTVTRDLLKNRLPAGIARSLVADLRTGVSSAFQRPITNPGTDMLGLHILIAGTEMRPELSSHGLTFNCLLFTRATSLRARMPATVQACFAHAEALWLLDGTLVAYGRHGVAATATGDFNPAHTRTTWASVTDLLAWMATRQALATRFETVGDRVLAGCSRRIARNLRQRRLTTGAVKHYIGRLRTVCRLCILRMAALLTKMDTTIKRTTAELSTAETTCPTIGFVIITHPLTIHLLVFGTA